MPVTLKSAASSYIIKRCNLAGSRIVRQTGIRIRDLGDCLLSIAHREKKGLVIHPVRKLLDGSTEFRVDGFRSDSGELVDIIANVSLLHLMLLIAYEAASCESK